VTPGAYLICLGVDVPYETPPQENFWNSMMFWVRVPVLSEKIYETIPSSSLRFEEFTLADISFSPSYNRQSDSMNYAWKSFTISRVTRRDIETKFCSRMNH